VGVQEIRWDKRGTVRAGDYYYFYGKGNDWKTQNQIEPTLLDRRRRCMKFQGS